MADVNKTADVNATETEVIENQSNTATEPDSPDVKDLIKQLAEQKAQFSKLKKQFDKEASEKADLKKQLRAKMTADEQAEIERQEAAEEQKEYVASLERFKREAEATARYALQGMSQEMAKQAATAEISGDMDALADIQRKHTQQIVKAKEAEWLKSRPEINAGGGSGVKITQEQFDNMNMIERTKLFETNRKVYDALLANSK